jgi:hypothetical protein
MQIANEQEKSTQTSKPFVHLQQKIFYSEISPQVGKMMRFLAKMMCPLPSP